MNVFEKWLAPQVILLLMVSLAVSLSPVRRIEAATAVKDLRIGKSKTYVRMVLELDQPLASPPSVSINRDTMQIALTGIINDLSLPAIGKNHDDVVGLDVSKMANITRIKVTFSFLPSDFKVFSLAEPHRFIIDAYRPISKPGASAPFGNADVNQDRFQQRLIASLIGVTSIIVVLLFLLIWMGSGRKALGGASWIGHLPPTKDPDIETIDAEIREHLKSHDRR